MLRVGKKKQYDVRYHLKTLEKEQQSKSKVCKRDKIIKTKADINRTETIDPKVRFFEKVNKMDKLLTDEEKEHKSPILGKKEDLSLQIL